MKDMNGFEFDPSKIRDREGEQYQINTGWIFSVLRENWEAFEEHFLKGLVEESLQAVLLKRGVVTYHKKEGEEAYFDRVEKEYAKFDVRKGENAFPLPEYFINHDSLIDYKTEVTLEKGETHFELFFALQLALLPLMEVRAFLNYHFQHSFKNDTIAFKNFLLDLFRAYPTVFQNQNKEVALEALTQLPAQSSQAHSEINLNGHDTDQELFDEKGATLHQQCLAMYFMLNCFGLYDKTGEPIEGIQKKDIHSLIAFFTGKHPDNIKKMVRGMFSKEDILDENLRIIRPYFEKLKLNEIVKGINFQLKG